MSHAACQPPHGIHLLRLPELSFQLLLLYFMLLSLVFVPLQCDAHVIESPRDLRYLIATLRFQRIAEITLFEGAHSLCEVRQRPRGPVRNHEHQCASP